MIKSCDIFLSENVNERKFISLEEADDLMQYDYDHDAIKMNKRLSNMSVYTFKDNEGYQNAIKRLARHKVFNFVLHDYYHIIFFSQEFINILSDSLSNYFIDITNKGKNIWWKVVAKPGSAYMYREDIAIERDMQLLISAAVIAKIFNKDLGESRISSHLKFIEMALKRLVPELDIMSANGHSRKLTGYRIDIYNSYILE